MFRYFSAFSWIACKPTMKRSCFQIASETTVVNKMSCHSWVLSMISPQSHVIVSGVLSINSMFCNHALCY